MLQILYYPTNGDMLSDAYTTHQTLKIAHFSAEQTVEETLSVMGMPDFIMP